MTNTNKYEEYRMCCSFNPSHVKPAASKMFETFFFPTELGGGGGGVGGGQKNADATAERNEPTSLRLPLSLRHPPARPFPRVHGGIISH